MWFGSSLFQAIHPTQPNNNPQFDRLYGQTAQTIQDMNLASIPLQGSNWESEGSDISTATANSMYQALDMRGGDTSVAAMQQYTRESNASLFDTDLTSLKELARNARYGDHIGSM